MGGRGSGRKQWCPMPPRADVRAVVAVIAGAHGYAVDDILHTRARSPRFAAIRNEAIRAVSAKWPLLSSPQLGEIFDRHHTTILHALGRLNKVR